MQSCAWMNGQYQQFGQTSQSSQAATQLTQETRGNMQAGTANKVHQYRTTNTGVRPPQSAYFIFRNFVSNRLTSNGQTSAVPHQAVSSQHPAGGNNNSSNLKVSNGNLQSPSYNTQSGNPCSQGIYGFQVQRDFHQNSSTQSPSDTMKANTTYSQKDMSANWNQSVLSTRIQSGNVVSDLQRRRVQRNLHQNVNGEQSNCISAFTTTATSLPPAQTVCNGTLMSATAHSIPTIANQHHRQNSTQRGLPPSILPPAYNVSQSYRNFTTNSSSSVESLHISSTSPKTQRYSTQLNSTPNNGEVATSSLHTGMRFDSKGRMMESNPTMTPVPLSIIEHFKSLRSGQSLPKTTQNLILATNHNVDQLKQQPESISPQRNKTHSSVPVNHEICQIIEMLKSVNPNDSSIHSSPGRTGPRAIAVVQPLAQECYQVDDRHTFSKTINQERERTTTDESLSHPEKFLISLDVTKNKKPLYLREVKDDCGFPSENQVRSNKSAIRHLGASNNCAVVSSSAGPQHSQKQLCTYFTGSEPTNMQLDQIVAKSTQQSVTSEVSESQNADKDESEMPPDAKACELSSLPTTPWTLIPILKLLQETEDAQKKSEVFPEFNSAKELLSMYWDSSCKVLADKLRTGWYKDLIIEVQEFCRKHLTSDSVILSQIQYNLRKQLKSFHVIADNEVYSELPYTSSWLNTNEQLDEIDKEFGFPWSLKHRPHTLDSDSQPDQAKTVNSDHEIIVREVQNKALSQTELEPVDSDNEKHSTVEVTNSRVTESASPNETESVDSSDPYYSFEIQVLPPEEAKLIFDQIQSQMPQSTETVSQPEKVTNSPVEDELPEIKDVTISDSKLENGAVTPLEQICCIARWKQIILGSNKPSSSTCQCKKAKGGEDIVSQIQTFSWPELCNEVSQTIDLPDNEDKPYSYSDKDPNNISLLSMNSSQSSIIFISENKDENLSSSENEIPNQMPDLEENCEEVHPKPTESSQLTGSHSSDKVLSSESEVATQITTNLVEDCGQAQLTSPDVAESPLKTDGQTENSSTTASQTFSLKHETVDPGSQQHFEGVSKCGKVLVDSAGSEPLSSNIRTVELVLFGSASQESCALVGGHRSHRSSPHAVSEEVPRPPMVLSVSLSPHKRKPSGTVSKGEYSVKRCIYEKWRQGFPPTRIKHRHKLKTQKCSLSEVSLKKAERSGPSNTELPVSSEMKICNRNTKRCLRRRSLACGLKLGEKQTKKDEVTLKQSAVQKRSKAENGSQAVAPLQENNVLRFSVLPNTFSFKDSSNGLKDAEHVSDKADLVGANDESPNIPVKRARGAWYPNPEKQHLPLHPSHVPKTSSVFHEYQKKFTKKKQSSLDE